MISAAQINSFHMIASCTLACLGVKLYDLQRICDPCVPKMFCELEDADFWLESICGFVPEGEEILPFVYLYGQGVDAGDTIQLTVNGVAIMANYTFVDDPTVDFPALVAAVENYGSGFTLDVRVLSNTVFGILIAPVGSGNLYSNAITGANYAGITFLGGPMSIGYNAEKNNCLTNDQVLTIMEAIKKNLSLCGDLNTLPETPLLNCNC